jgi:hypothetical protein
MNKQQYLASCYQQLRNVFALAKQHKKDDQLKFRAEGFIHAGKSLGVISHQEAIEVMEQAHFEIFAENIATRRKRKASLKEAIAKGDDDFINIPAYERLPP